jgi:hypothetical protein
LRQRVTGALAVLLDPRLNNWTARTSQPPTYEAAGEFLLNMQTFVDYDNSVRHFPAQRHSTYWQAMLWAAMSYANLVAISRRFALPDPRSHRAPLATTGKPALFYAGFVTAATRSIVSRVVGS